MCQYHILMIFTGRVSQSVCIIFQTPNKMTSTSMYNIYVYVSLSTPPCSWTTFAALSILSIFIFIFIFTFVFEFVPKRNVSILRRKIWYHYRTQPLLRRRPSRTCCVHSALLGTHASCYSTSMCSVADWLGSTILLTCSSSPNVNFLSCCSPGSPNHHHDVF